VPQISSKEIFYYLKGRKTHTAKMVFTMDRKKFGQQNVFSHPAVV